MIFKLLYEILIYETLKKKVKKQIEFWYKRIWKTKKI